MTLNPVGLFWPRSSMMLLVAASLGFGGGWLAHRPLAPARMMAPTARMVAPMARIPVAPLLLALALPREAHDVERVGRPIAFNEVQYVHYRVLRAALARELNGFAASCRIVPTLRDSRPSGFKIYAIRPNSLFARLGLQNGDMIQRINGVELTTPDRALEIYTQVRGARLVRVDLARRGFPTHLAYDIID